MCSGARSTTPRCSPDRSCESPSHPPRKPGPCRRNSPLFLPGLSGPDAASPALTRRRATASAEERGARPITSSCCKLAHDATKPGCEAPTRHRSPRRRGGGKRGPSSRSAAALFFFPGGAPFTSVVLQDPFRSEGLWEYARSAHGRRARGHPAGLAGGRVRGWGRGRGCCCISCPALPVRSRRFSDTARLGRSLSPPPREPSSLALARELDRGEGSGHRPGTPSPPSSRPPQPLAAFFAKPEPPDRDAYLVFRALSPGDLPDTGRASTPPGPAVASCEMLWNRGVLSPHAPLRCRLRGPDGGAAAPTCRTRAGARPLTSGPNTPIPVR